MTLEAVQGAALAGAQAEADAIRAAGAGRAAELLAGARAEAAALVNRRSDAARALAEQERRERLAEARSEARAIILRAQRSVLTAAQSASHGAARQLAQSPRYAALCDELAAEARGRLAPAGTVEIEAAAGGGFVARAGTRELDYSLDAQIARCLQAVSGELEALWR